MHKSMDKGKENLIENGLKKPFDIAGAYNFNGHKRSKQTARKSTSNRKDNISKMGVKRKTVDDWQSDNENIQPPIKKHCPTARKSTTGRLFKAQPARNKKFCCHECEMPFLTPAELIEHSKEEHKKLSPHDDEERSKEDCTKSLPNNSENENEIQILEVIEGKKKCGNEYPKQKYYYFCLDCEEEKGNLKQNTLNF